MKPIFYFGLMLLGAASTVSAEAPTQAWVTFDTSRIIASGAEVLADRGNGRALTVEDPVRVASVSKLVVTLGVMRMVERGQLNLDEDAGRWLGWPLRHPDFPDRPISLRMLLSHQSGLIDASDEALPRGQSVREATQRAGVFDRQHQPGSFFRYANLNYVVIGAVMEGASGQRFDRLMRRLVLMPLALKACFGWDSCSSRERLRGVTLYGADGRVRADGTDPAACFERPVRGRCDLGSYVLRSSSARFGPQGGLRISMTDLARVGQMLLSDGRVGRRRFLTPASLREMRGPAWRFDGRNGDTTQGFFCTFGFGVQTIPTKASGCADRLLSDDRVMIGHAGEAYGLLSGLWVDRRAGRGIAFFSANESGDRRNEGSAFYNVERLLAAHLEP